MELALRAPALPPPPSARPPLLEVTLDEVAALHAELLAYHAEFVPLCCRAEQRRWALKYTERQLLPLERKSIALIADALTGVNVQAMQQFISLGAIGTLPLRAGGTDVWPTLVLVVPLTAVLSLAHPLRAPRKGLREVEAATPAATAETLLGLVLAILGFDCALGIGAIAGLTLIGWSPFLATLAAWLGPLFLLAGLSLPVALHWGSGAAAIACGGPWLLLAIATHLQPVGLYSLPQDPSDLAGRFAAATLCSLFLLHTFLRGPAWPARRKLFLSDA